MQLPVSLKKRTCHRRSSRCSPIANAAYISVSPIPPIWIGKLANLFRLHPNMAKFTLALGWISQDTVRGPQQVRRLLSPDALHSPSRHVAQQQSRTQSNRRRLCTSRNLGFPRWSQNFCRRPNSFFSEWDRPDTNSFLSYGRTMFLWQNSVLAISVHVSRGLGFCSSPSVMPVWLMVFSNPI